MRFFLCLFAAPLFFLFTILSCKNTQRVSFIKASLEKDTTSLMADTTSAFFKKDSIPFVDDLKVEFSQKLHVPLDSINDLKLYRFVKDNLGKKCFAVKSSSFTCECFLSTLIKEVYGIDFPNTVEEQMKYKNITLFKNSNFLQQGDLLFFNTLINQKDKITHAGFYLQNGFFLVASYTEGVVITKLQSKYWSKHFLAAGRYSLFSSQKNKQLVFK